MGRHFSELATVIHSQHKSKRRYQWKLETSHYYRQGLLTQSGKKCYIVLDGRWDCAGKTEAKGGWEFSILRSSFPLSSILPLSTSVHPPPATHPPTTHPSNNWTRRQGLEYERRIAKRERRKKTFLNRIRCDWVFQVVFDVRECCNNLSITSCTRTGLQSLTIKLWTFHANW